MGCENKKSYKYGKVGVHKNGKKVRWSYLEMKLLLIVIQTFSQKGFKMFFEIMYIGCRNNPGRQGIPCVYDSDTKESFSCLACDGGMVYFIVVTSGIS